VNAEGFEPSTACLEGSIQYLKNQYRSTHYSTKN
jgi:hypothetical protein